METINPMETIFNGIENCLRNFLNEMLSWIFLILNILSFLFPSCFYIAQILLIARVVFTPNINTCYTSFTTILEFQPPDTISNYTLFDVFTRFVCNRISNLIRLEKTTRSGVKIRKKAHLLIFQKSFNAARSFQENFLPQTTLFFKLLNISRVFRLEQLSSAKLK